MFRFLCVGLFGLALSTSEQVCSRFHYEEQTLKKMIVMELLVEKFKAELAGTIQSVNDDLTEFKAEREVLKQQFDKLQSSVTKDMEKNMKEILEKRGSFEETILFSAREVQNKCPVEGETLVFNTTVINKGSGYDNTTGIFTAPVEGVFMFTLQLCVNQRKVMYFGIVADDVPLLKSIIFDEYSIYLGCYTSSAPAFLTVGQRVWVKVDTTSQDALWESSESNWNMFTGVLIHK